MQQRNPEVYLDQTVQVDLRKLAKTLKEGRHFIFGFTAIVTLLSLIFLLTLPPTPYIVKTSFIKADDSSVLQLNKSGFLDETNKTVYFRS